MRRVGDLTGLVLLERAPLMKAALTLDMPIPNPRDRNAATTLKCDHEIGIIIRKKQRDAHQQTMKWGQSTNDEMGTNFVPISNKELTIVRLGYGDDAVAVVVEERGVLLQVGHAGALRVAAVRRRATHFPVG